MINKYRLTSTIYNRENDEDKIEPLKIYFLSVEGNATEKEYFEGVSAYRDILGINMKVDVEVLKRSSKDTNSAPKQVIELLEEYLELRDSDGKSVFNEIPGEFIEKYGSEFITKYFEKSIITTLL